VSIIGAIIEAREKAELTQQQLAEKSGVKQPMISRIEKMKNDPQLSTIMQLLYPLGKTLEIVDIV
jgi:predicted transcriptional regulator